MNTIQVMQKTDPLCILFVVEKWCDCNPKMGESNSLHNFIGSFDASGLGSYDTFFYDEYYYLNQEAGDEELLNKCKISPPQLIVLLWHPQDFSGKDFNISLETLYQIKNNLKIPIVSIWCDSVWPMVMNQAELLLPFCELNIVIDSMACLQNTSQPEKYLNLWSPQDPRLFYNPELDRDINISFVGSLNLPHLLERQSLINALKREPDIELYQAGGQRQEDRLTVEQYARVHMRSKISLNFSKAGNNLFQRKGRVFEVTLCGAMLLEQENWETARFFEPMVDYVSFTDEKDLVEKAKYYLNHDSERMEIAQRGHNKAKEKYTGELFWKAVLSKLQINVNTNVSSQQVAESMQPVVVDSLVYQLERMRQELYQTQISLHQTQISLHQAQIELNQIDNDNRYPSASLVEDFGYYNIVEWRGNYYGLPKELGPIDVMKDDLSLKQDILIDISAERLKNLIYKVRAIRDKNTEQETDKTNNRKLGKIIQSWSALLSLWWGRAAPPP